MKKHLSFQGYLLVGFSLLVAHVVILRSRIVISNEAGRNNETARRLQKLDDELFSIRGAIEYNFCQEFSTLKLGQKLFFGNVPEIQHCLDTFHTNLGKIFKRYFKQHVDREDRRVWGPQDRAKPAN